MGAIIPGTVFMGACVRDRVDGGRKEIILFLSEAQDLGTTPYSHTGSDISTIYDLRDTKNSTHPYPSAWVIFTCHLIY